jgi:hypothetical protein
MKPIAPALAVIAAGLLAGCSVLPQADLKATLGSGMRSYCEQQSNCSPRDDTNPLPKTTHGY